MIITGYKVNKLKGAEAVEKVTSFLKISDDPESNKKMIRFAIEALEQLTRNEDLMLEYVDLVSSIEKGDLINEIKTEEDLA